MAVRRSLIIDQGQVRELSGDDGIQIGLLPLANNLLPEAVLVRQESEWRAATIEQLKYWLASIADDESLLTVDGEAITVNGAGVYVNYSG